MIEFEEFAAWAEKHKALTVRPREAGPDEEEMMQLFRVFDKDGDGSINAKDLHDTMKDLGLVLTRDDTTAMMKEAGLGPDGNIHYKGIIIQHFYRAMYLTSLVMQRHASISILTLKALLKIK